jgi:hypothetical protein
MALEGVWRGARPVLPSSPLVAAQPMTCYLTDVLQAAVREIFFA